MLTVLAFLVILPLGEHFHIVTALPALYFRRGGPANRVPRVDLEAMMEGNDAELEIGVRTARDLDAGRTASMRSRAPNAAAARTPVRRSSPASRCR